MQVKFRERFGLELQWQLHPAVIRFTYLVHKCLINDFLYPVGFFLLFYLLTVKFLLRESENVPILQENGLYSDWKQKLWTAVMCCQSLAFTQCSSVIRTHSDVARTEPGSPDKWWYKGGDCNTQGWSLVEWPIFSKPSIDIWSLTFCPLKTCCGTWLKPLAKAKWTSSIDYFSTDVCSYGYEVNLHAHEPPSSLVLESWQLLNRWRLKPSESDLNNLEKKNERD